MTKFSLFLKTDIYRVSFFSYLCVDMKKLSVILLMMLSMQALHAVTLRYYPYELKLRHAFNLASMSRRATPGVQVEITIDSITGYG